MNDYAPSYLIGKTLESTSRSGSQHGNARPPSANNAFGRLAAPPLDWLDPLKAFALLGILLNHLVEELGPGPWFTNPSSSWPPLAERLQTFFPVEDPSGTWSKTRPYWISPIRQAFTSFAL